MTTARRSCGEAAGTEAKSGRRVGGTGLAQGVVGVSTARIVARPDHDAAMWGRAELVVPASVVHPSVDADRFGVPPHRWEDEARADA